jgi:hypothetical protein
MLQLVACTWLGLVAAHIVLAFVPLLIWKSDYASWIAGYSYFPVLQLLQRLGVPAIGPFQEGMFMVPPTKVGNIGVVCFWLLVHLGVAFIVSKVLKLRA